MDITTNNKYRKLRGKIVEKYGNCTSFAKDLGWHKSYLSSKLCGKVGFTLDDIELIRQKLELSVDEIGSYFFA